MDEIANIIREVDARWTCSPLKLLESAVMLCFAGMKANEPVRKLLARYRTKITPELRMATREVPLGSLLLIPQDVRLVGEARLYQYQSRKNLADRVNLPGVTPTLILLCLFDVQHGK